MLITHDMGVIAETADRVAVMYAGRIAEIGPVRDVVQRPRHPYTKGLMGAIPTLGGPCRPAGADPRLHAAARRHPDGLRLPSALRARLRRAAAPSGPSACRPGSSRGGLLAGGRERAAGGARHERRPRRSSRCKSLTRVFDVSKPWLNRVIERRGQGLPEGGRRACPSPSAGARRWRWWASRARASRRWRAWWWACCAPTAGTVTIDGIDMWATGARRPSARSCAAACR